MNNREVALNTLELLQQSRDADEGVLRKILLGLSCRNYQLCAETEGRVDAYKPLGAAVSLEEGLEETLTLHRLGLLTNLG